MGVGLLARGLIFGLDRLILEDKDEGALMKVSQEKVRFPLTLSDLLELRGRKIAIRIEICENGSVAFLEEEDDFFAAGKTIKEARENLIKSLEDELSFLYRHRDELGPDLKEKYRFLQGILR
ncbi:hypothetical protein KAX17_04370 [Candidatus Bipolaricaulota bacterium]|nr:hypothetical protein [Candidatus Bipolaricaulota bacterium]